MLFDENELNTLENELKIEEEIKRSGKYPDYEQIKPSFSAIAHNLPVTERENITGTSDPYLTNLNRTTYDTIGASFYTLRLLYEKSNWVKFSNVVISQMLLSAKPLYRIKSESDKVNSVKDIDELLKYPNKNTTRHELFTNTIHSLTCTGNAYWQVIKKRNGKVHSIHYIVPDSIRVVPFVNKKDGQIDYAYLHINMLQNTIDRVYFSDEIIHFKLPNPFNELYGLTELSGLLLDCTFDLEAKKYISSWFQQSFMGGMIFEMKNSNKDAVRRNRQEMREKFEGSKNAGRTLVLEGDMTLVSDGNKMRDIDFTKLKQVSRDDIFNTFGIPLSQAGIRSDSGNGNEAIINAEIISALRNIVYRYRDIIYERINLSLFRNILKDPDLTIEAGTDGTFSLANASNIVSSASKYAGTTINENREIMGLPVIDNKEDSKYYDKPLVSTNNGILPLPTLFNNFENSSQMGANTNAGVIKQPSLKVSTEQSKIKVD